MIVAVILVYVFFFDPLLNSVATFCCSYVFLYFVLRIHVVNYLCTANAKYDCSIFYDHLLLFNVV